MFQQGLHFAGGAAGIEGLDVPHGSGTTQARQQLAGDAAQARLDGIGGEGEEDDLIRAGVDQALHARHAFVRCAGDGDAGDGGIVDELGGMAGPPGRCGPWRHEVVADSGVGREGARCPPAPRYSEMGVPHGVARSVAVVVHGEDDVDDQVMGAGISCATFTANGDVLAREVDVGRAAEDGEDRAVRDLAA